MEYFDNKFILDFEQYLDIHELKEFSDGSGVRVAIVDSGLSAQSYINEDVVFGMNMYDREKGYEDDLGHGTAVASILKRIAPECELLIFKCLNDRGTGAIMNVMDGITGAISWKADIIITSLCMENSRVPVGLEAKFRQATKKGIIIVAPTGNLNEQTVQFPAVDKKVWGIAGIDMSTNQRAYFSNFGDGVDFIAPSMNIETLGLNNEQVFKTGTSYSAPIVAGMLTLSKSYVINNKEVDKDIDSWYDVFKESCSSNISSTDGGHGLPNGKLLLELIK